MGAATSPDGIAWTGGLFALHDAVDYGSALYLNKVSCCDEIPYICVRMQNNHLQLWFGTCVFIPSSWM